MNKTAYRVVMSVVMFVYSAGCGSVFVYSICMSVFSVCVWGWLFEGGRGASKG